MSFSELELIALEAGSAFIAGVLTGISTQSHEPLREYLGSLDCKARQKTLSNINTSAGLFGAVIPLFLQGTSAKPFDFLASVAGAYVGHKVGRCIYPVTSSKDVAILNSHVEKLKHLALTNLHEADEYFFDYVLPAKDKFFGKRPLPNHRREVEAKFEEFTRFYAINKALELATNQIEDDSAPSIIRHPKLDAETYCTIKPGEFCIYNPATSQHTTKRWAGERKDLADKLTSENRTIIVYSGNLDHCELQGIARQHYESKLLCEKQQ